MVEVAPAHAARTLRLRDNGEVPGVALITGGNRGIGWAAARALAREGFTVALVARSKPDLDHRVTRIIEAGGRAAAFPGDVTNPEQVAAFVASAEQLGPIELVVNNAGVFGPMEPFGEADPDEWWRALEVNLRGPMLCARAALPEMLARRRGRIVNVTSRQGNRPDRTKNAYSTSKAALTRWTEALAVDHPNSGVTFFALAPGPTPTDMTRVLEAKRAELAGKPKPPGSDVPAPDVPLDHGAIRILVAIALGKLDALNGRYLSVEDDVDALVKMQTIKDDDTRVLRLRT